MHGRSRSSAWSELDQGTFAQGMRTGIPIVLATSPFGLLFGALAAANGFSVFEATLMSATIFAGASQLVGIELFGQRIAPWVIVMSIFAVNFRHILYSASIGRVIGAWPAWRQAVAFFFLIDPQYAECEKRIEEKRGIGFAWYMGMALPFYVAWVIEAAIGAYFGKLLPDPERWGIDFIMSFYFLGLVLSFRGRALFLPVVLASAAASIAAFHFIGSPWHVSIGAAAGIALAAVWPLDADGGKRA